MENQEKLLIEKKKKREFQKKYERSLSQLQKEREEYLKLSRKFESLKKELAKEKEEVRKKSCEISKLGNELKEQKSIIVSNNREMKRLYRTISSYEKRRMNNSNVKREMGKLIKKQTRLKRIVNELKEKKEPEIKQIKTKKEPNHTKPIQIEQKNKVEIKRLKEIEPKERKTETGYIRKNKNKEWFFCDLNQNQYPIEANSFLIWRKFLKPNQPIEVELSDQKEAIITQIYRVGKLKETNVVKTERERKRKRIKKDDEVHVPLPNANVLIVGSRNKERYIEKMKKHGLEIEWHDPFSEHDNRLKDKYDRSEVVIVCTSHVNHNVFGIVDREDERVECMEKDNEANIAARIRYHLLHKKR